MSEQAQNPNPNPDENPNENPNPTPGEEPFIPPQYMLYLAGVALLVALYAGFTQTTQSVIFWGGLGFAILAVGAWAMVAPQSARQVLAGRTLRFGGTSVLVTVLVILAMALVYAFVQSRGWRKDLTQRDLYSLTDQSRQLIKGIGGDPNVPPLKILSFTTAAQGSDRDQQSVLFDDYKATSGGKITYQFVNPDTDPITAKQYSAQNSDIFVVKIKDGQPDIKNAQKASFFQEEEVTNAILRASAYGDYRAYFLSVENGLKLDDTGQTGMSTLNDVLTKQYAWKTQTVSLTDLMSASSTTKLNDPAADGIVLIIPGGTKSLSDDQVKFLGDYLDKGGKDGKGGSLIILASLNTDNTQQTTLANSQNLSDMLYNKFGVRFANNVVLDPSLTLNGSPTLPAISDFDSTHYITSDLVKNLDALVMQAPYYIEQAPTAPADVTVTALAHSSDKSYSKAVPDVLANNFTKADKDQAGPLIVAATAENAKTGGRVVLFGSELIAANALSQINQVANLRAIFRSIEWGAHYSDQFGRVPIQPRPQDQPLAASPEELSNINFLTVILMPFGVLALGIYVWWRNRERAAA